MHKHGLTNMHEQVKPIVPWDLKEQLDEFALIFLSFAFWLFLFLFCITNKRVHFEDRIRKGGTVFL